MIASSVIFLVYILFPLSFFWCIHSNFSSQVKSYYKTKRHNKAITCNTLYFQQDIHLYDIFQQDILYLELLLLVLHLFICVQFINELIFIAKNEKRGGESKILNKARKRCFEYFSALRLTQPHVWIRLRGIFGSQNCHHLIWRPQ